MSFCVEISPPWSRALTTLDRVKSAAGTETDPQGNVVGGIALPSDDELTRLILAASAEIEKSIHRPQQLLRAQYREYIEGPGTTTVMLSVTPVISVDAVSYQDQAMPDVDWVLDPTTGILFRKTGWNFTGQIWRGVSDTRMPGPGAPDYVIDYTAGYSSPDQDLYGFTLPPNIEQACIRTVIQWTQTQSRDLTVQRTRIGDVTQTFFAGSNNLGGALGLPSDVRDMLQPYVRVV